MKQSHTPPAFSGEQPPEKEKQIEQKAEESCRCKEASKKTPLELLKLMISDLSFWKKE
ncbi:MAG TPA: hypothetical protein VJW95_03595 [Dissulfurispiraceae bacterium]|nr:hypothetical protein [Dissulfurispiraceae bacterium]